MLYWLLMMAIMVIISNNDKLQIVSSGSIRRLLQTMLWLTLSEFYQILWPILLQRLQQVGPALVTLASAAPEAVSGPNSSQLAGLASSRPAALAIAAAAAAASTQRAPEAALSRWLAERAQT